MSGSGFDDFYLSVSGNGTAEFGFKIGNGQRDTAICRERATGYGIISGSGVGTTVYIGNGLRGLESKSGTGIGMPLLDKINFVLK